MNLATLNLGDITGFKTVVSYCSIDGFVVSCNINLSVFCINEFVLRVSCISDVV